MNIAFLGLGGMGGGMARNLIKHGHTAIAWNRSPRPAEAIHPAGFKMALGQKDNRLVQLAAEKLEVPLPFVGILRDRFPAALAHGDGELDWSAVAKRAAADAGVTPT
jgi:3-hydroxyisobutyrate dehydrogenase-like beta-hydroxyacid dehydrogenase